MTRHPLAAAHELLTEFIEQYNDETRDYNALVDDNERLERAVAELRIELKRKEELLLHVHADRKALLEKHNRDVSLANAEIEELAAGLNTAKRNLSELNNRRRQHETDYASAQVELKQLRELNGKELKRKLENTKERNDELNKENKRLADNNLALSRRNKELRAELDNASKPLWSLGKEKIMRHHETVIIARDENGPTRMEHPFWWEHERGIRMLCAYDETLETVIICDPCDDTGHTLLPSKAAEAAMVALMRKALRTAA